MAKDTHSQRAEKETNQRSYVKNMRGGESTSDVKNFGSWMKIPFYPVI